jgi:hypothetical protein
LFLFAKQTTPNQTTGGQWYSDTSPLSIPCLSPMLQKTLRLQFINVCNKLECLSLADLYSLV